MGRYDVHASRSNDPAAPYLLDLQADLLSHLRTRLVAPLRPASSRRPIGILDPIVEIEGGRYLVSVTEMASVPRDLLGRPVANLGDRHFEFRAATDLLLSGF